MTYRSEMAAIVSAIWNVKAELKRLVVAQETGKPVSYHTYRDWAGLSSRLTEAIDFAADNNPDLGEILYHRGVRNIRREVIRPEVEEFERRRLAKAEPPALTAKERKALEFVRKKGKVKGILIARHIGVSEPRFRSAYVPKLRPHGLRNDRDGEGYYVDES